MVEIVVLFVDSNLPIFFSKVSPSSPNIASLRREVISFLTGLIKISASYLFFALAAILTSTCPGCARTPTVGFFDFSMISPIR